MRTLRQTGSVQAFEYVNNNTGILVPLKRESGEIVSLEVYYDAMKDGMLTRPLTSRVDIELKKPLRTIRGSIVTTVARYDIWLVGR